jgi:hypothetical protein
MYDLDIVIFLELEISRFGESYSNPYICGKNTVDGFAIPLAISKPGQSNGKVGPGECKIAALREASLYWHIPKIC